MFDKSRPFELGDIFSITFNLFKKTFSRNIIIAVAFLAPAGLLMAYGFDAFFSSLMETAKESIQSSYEYGNTQTQLPANFFANLGLYALAIFAFMFGYLGVMIGTTKISFSEMQGERISIGEAFAKVFSVTLFRCIGQSILVGFVISASIFVGVFIIGLGAASGMIGITILGVLTIIAGIFLMIYLVYKWYFAFVSIVGEDNYVFDSFSKSSYLVKGNWWRVFGILLLTSIIVDFGISIITTPLSFILMWDFIMQYFKMIAEGGMINNDPSSMVKMFESFGFSFGILIIISTILDSLVTPLINVVMYFDLKIRKNDFPAENPETNLTNEGIVIE